MDVSWAELRCFFFDKGARPTLVCLLLLLLLDVGMQTQAWQHGGSVGGGVQGAGEGWASA